MIRIGLVGDIGSGKSFLAKKFGYPVFNADHEVAKLYKKEKRVFLKLKTIIPKYIFTFPINKKEITKAILANEQNLKKIVKIVHVEIKKKMLIFLRKNKLKKVVILDIPLLLENKLNRQKDIIIFVKSQRSQIYKRLKKRKNFNQKLFNKFKKLQLPLDYKRRRSNFTIKNDFTGKSVKKDVKAILKKIL